MADGRSLVELYFDVLSPYSYVSFVLFNRCSKRWKTIQLDLKPVLIGGILQASGTNPPAKLPARGNYIWKDMARITDFYDIPYHQPEDLPTVLFKKGSLKPMRLLTAVERKYPEHLFGVASQIYGRIWQRDLDITESSSLMEACTAAGLPEDNTRKLLDMMSHDDVKQALKKTTSEALGNGAFGLPSYILHTGDKKELYFGTDRIFLLAHDLGEDWPVAKR